MFGFVRIPNFLRPPVQPTVAPPSPSAPPNAEQRVARGVALLDQNMPGWADRVDLTRFSITSTGYCVLAQVYNASYDNAACYLRLDIPERRACGFSCGPGVENHEYPALELAWRKVIYERQTA